MKFNVFLIAALAATTSALAIPSNSESGLVLRQNQNNNNNNNQQNNQNNGNQNNQNNGNQNNQNNGNQNNQNNGNQQNNNQQQNNNNNNQNNNNNNNNGGATAGDAAAGDAAGGAADFGSCTPTMDFQLGRAGRKATEGTFLPTDAKVAQGQQDALNPNIITNRICDQLTNVCGANAAAKAQCQAAKAQVAALGTKDASTAAAFNQALGF
ncbi:uncharacterized protein B0I36DRAFT_338393 [Microdochium trichocladiopsis]|uniref:Uncharacterized protein n=1 Tax=Microdochium trichocladiopsis TaxID=1682393 RepID=A0A9P8XS15_9PEZI|nr:uncharacterized protein B0I36DRAFT_338393 [Microdochium trichocladiopsis]KAH7014201.1 hypothetical protein B0I36DRAFT_338393 [Microdochium trichocladiopsis]